MSDKDMCSIGLKTKKICHRQKYVKTKEIKKVTILIGVKKVDN